MAGVSAAPVGLLEVVIVRLLLRDSPGLKPVGALAIAHRSQKSPSSLTADNLFVGDFPHFDLFGNSSELLNLSIFPADIGYVNGIPSLLSCSLKGASAILFEHLISSQPTIHRVQ